MDRQWLEGRVEWFDTKSGYGFVHHEKHGKVLVHSRSLGHGVDPTMIKPGILVRFRLDQVRPGPVGRLVTPVVEEISEQPPVEAKAELEAQEVLSQPVEKGISTAVSPEDTLSRLKTPSEYLAAALLYREQKRSKDARRIYQEGLERAPGVQLVLSFAAFERGANRPEAARKVYRKGVALFPNHQKLHEDAGVLELKTGHPGQATKYFERALALDPPKGSRANLNRWLGAAYFQLATQRAARINWDLLAKAKNNLEKANRLRGLSLKEVNLLHRINAIRINARAFRSFELFERAGFAIVQIFRPDTHNIDFIVEPTSEELRTTYGLEEAILVRHLLTEPKMMELRNLDAKLEVLTKEERADPSLAFLIVRTSRALMSALRRRLESGGQHTTIIPIELQAFDGDADTSNQFRNVLDQWLFRRDLYRDNFPVSGSHFFGRERQLKSLFACVSEGRHVGIFGLRKVGKTSFLWRVRDKSDSDLVAYVDLLAVPSAAKSCNYVFWLLGNELAKDFRRKYPNLAKKVGFRMFGVYENFGPLLDTPISLLFDNDLNRLRKALLHAKLDSPPKIVILIDEVERLLAAGSVSKGFEGYLDFFSYWRGQAQQHRDVVTVITGANPAITEQAQWEKIANPVYKFYEEEFLPPFDFGECTSMVRELGVGMGVRYTGGALNRIYGLTGGHPFIARRLCSRICQRRPARPLKVDERMVQDAIPDFMQEDSSLFDEILERLERDFTQELQVLELIAKRRKVSREEIRKLVGRRAGTIIHHLIGYQLISQRHGWYQIGIELLREYMLDR